MHQQQQPGGCHSLQDEPAGHDLLITPAQTLAHMVVQRGQGILEDGDVQKPLEADLQDAQAAVHNEHQRGQQEGEGAATLLIKR